MTKCCKCGKETNRIAPDFNLNTETYKIDMQFICEDCFDKKYEDLKQYFYERNQNLKQHFKGKGDLVDGESRD